MKKLISIGIVLALLVTLSVPVAVGASVPPPVGAPVPTVTHVDTIGGALLWTLLGTTYIMGRAVGDTTEHMAGTLGFFVDELSKPIFGTIGALMRGVGGLLIGLGGLIGMEALMEPLGTALTNLADMLEALLVRPR